MGRTLVALLVIFMFVPLLVLGWLKFGMAPVAVNDPPLPLERQLCEMAVNARIAHDLVLSPRLPADEENLVAGAHIYGEKCAVCHGYHGKPSSFGAHMFPAAPPLFEKHHNNDVVGVSDDPAGETYWKVANGIRLTGMPSYKQVLAESQMWQVSLLLANADKPLPPAALDILRGQPASAPVVPAPKTPAKR